MGTERVKESGIERVRENGDRVNEGTWRLRKRMKTVEQNDHREKERKQT